MSVNNPYSQPHPRRPGYGSNLGGQVPGGPVRYPVPTGPGAAPVSRHNPGGGFSGGVRFALLYVVAIWAVFLLNSALFRGNLNYFGIHPLDPSSLWGIITAPLLHANLEHLISNTIPGAVFAFLIGFSGRRVFWEVTVIVVIVAGVGTWLLGGVGTNHIGASGVVYGWLAYLIVRGIFNRSLSQIITGAALGFFYSGLVFGLLPGTPGVSWQGHLFGAVGGVLAGLCITSDDPPALKARKQARTHNTGR